MARPENRPLSLDPVLLQPGTLWPKVVERTQHALQVGALLPLPSECQVVEQGGLRFVVRILANLARKEQAAEAQQRRAGAAKDPFLPYDETLFVADISASHVCLLNKFNVVDHHLLLVTRAFEEQESLLTGQDFAALWACMDEVDGLAFYNGGKTAGASQRHKHLQIVPLPLAPKGPALPVESALAAIRLDGDPARTPLLSFEHAVGRLDPRWTAAPTQAATELLARYHQLLRAVGLGDESALQTGQQPGPYNLLLTRRWMLLVPRSQEAWAGISVNALGFAGSLLVRNREQLQAVQDHGPLNVLRNVAIRRDG